MSIRYQIIVLTILTVVVGLVLLAGKVTSQEAFNRDKGVTIVAAGDIASCESQGDEATAEVVEKINPDVVLTLGDTTDHNGTYEELRDCYQPSWGRFKSITYPVLGNHDYGQGGFEDRHPDIYDASGFHSYFDISELGYYSFSLGDWLLVALNSNCFVVGCEEGSEQYEWLKQELWQSDPGCLLAYWHHPVYSHGYYEEPYAMQEIWHLLYSYGADVILNGHDHVYDRRAMVDPASELDAEGIRQFVVGTGGHPLYEFGADKHTEVRSAEHLGVLLLSLLPDEYEWEFLTVGGDFTDRGNGACHKR